MDYYQILNVSRNAPQEDIKKAYRILSRKYHPDNAGEQTRERFEQVQEAYATLGNEEKRNAYDQQLAAGVAGGRQKESKTDIRKKQQSNKQASTYKDLAAFYTGEYQNSFAKFFGVNIEKT